MPPLTLKADDLGALDAFAFAASVVLREGVRKGRQEEGGGEEGKNARWGPAQHERTGC